MNSLGKRYYPIERIQFAEHTAIEGSTLFIAGGLCDEAFALANQDIVRQMRLDIIDRDHDGYSDTILDVLPLAVKEGDAPLGAGVTRVLDGVVLMLAGKDEDGEQISEAGSSEGPLRDTILYGRPGAPDGDELIIRVSFIIKSGERMKRPGPLACHQAAEHIAEALRAALTNVAEQDFPADALRIYEHHRRPAKPKVLLVKEIMGQGAMHEKLLLPLQPCGIAGARSDIDMGNLPLLLSPLEALDGAVHALTCVGPSTKETSRHYFRDPLLLAALADEELDVCGVAFVGSPAIHQQKFMVAGRLGAWAAALDIDGAIVATEGYGNNHIDFAAHIEALAAQGIATVGATFCGNFGPLITGNSYTRYLVDCAKSASGLENSVLAENTMTAEDADIALGMLKALLAGEHVGAPADRWSQETRRQNLRKLSED
ncbi:MAG: glycine/sarcosine/betaine reductase component B subunit [Bacillota bacterium]|nr:glycine/sarcosine/betaine reductase component B subunit [Bacillota bacterium]